PARQQPGPRMCGSSHALSPPRTYASGTLARSASMRLPVAVRTLALSVALALSAGAVSAQDTPAATPATVTDAGEQARRLDAWFAEKYQEQLRFSPISLTFLGRKELYDQLDDMSDEAGRRQLAWLEATVAELERSFDRATLDDEARLSWDLWTLQYENARDAMRFRDNVYVFNQMQGAQSLLPTFLINFHRVDEESDYLAYLARIEAVPRAFGQMLERAKRNAEAGYRMPRFAYDGVLDEARKVVG